MTKRLYEYGAELTLNAQIDWVGGVVKAHLLRNTYTPNWATHDFRSSVVSHIVATITLASKSGSRGRFDAADLLFPGVPAGNTCNAVVFSYEGGSDATSPLLLYVDSADITNFPVTTSGGDVRVTLPETAYKVFSLVP